jgi:hypothetical protein
VKSGSKVLVLLGVSVVSLMVAGGGFAKGPPGGLDVNVVNDAASPVPVVGEVSANVTGSVQAEQAGDWSVGAEQVGPWNVGASQSGAWDVGITGTPTVKIDSSDNDVTVAPRETQLLLNVAFDVIDDGQTIELGPVDVSDSSLVRVMTRAVNGEVEFDIRSEVPGGSFVLERYRIGAESGGNEYRTTVYEIPGTSLTIDVTESGGPGAANYGVVVIGN